MRHYLVFKEQTNEWILRHSEISVNTFVCSKSKKTFLPVSELNVKTNIAIHQIKFSGHPLLKNSFIISTTLWI
jgi:hypothetical protein